MRLSLREDICDANRLGANPEVLTRRTYLLAPGDCDLMEAVLLRGQSAAGLARATGACPRAVLRRVRTLARRMTSRTFMQAARAMQHMSEQDAYMARLHFCQGLSQRELCQRLNLTAHTVRRRLDLVAAQVRVLSTLRQREM